MDKVEQFLLETMSTDLHMPEGATVLTAQCHGGQLYLYAQVHLGAAIERRRFVVLHTGQEVNDFAWTRYIATVALSRDLWTDICHVFEVLRPAST